MLENEQLRVKLFIQTQLSELLIELQRQNAAVTLLILEQVSQNERQLPLNYKLVLHIELANNRDRHLLRKIARQHLFCQLIVADLEHQVLLVDTLTLKLQNLHHQISRNSLAPGQIAVKSHKQQHFLVKLRLVY